ncbi:MAG: maleylpyruvate isomerase N-terminal domain-containing protein [Candidatus Rokuibacteriota bacterium]
MRHTRKDVIDRARREFAALDRLVKRLRSADWKRRVPRPPTRDPWTVKDALAHIVYWKEHTARVIRGERRLPEMRGLDVDQINRVIYRRWRRQKASEVVAWHRRAHDDVLRTLARTPAEWFARRERSPQWPADLDGHSAAHRVKDIEAALGNAATAGRPSRRSRRRASPGRR